MRGRTGSHNKSSEDEQGDAGWQYCTGSWKFGIDMTFTELSGRISLSPTLRAVYFGNFTGLMEPMQEITSFPRLHVLSWDWLGEGEREMKIRGSGIPRKITVGKCFG